MKKKIKLVLLWSARRIGLFYLARKLIRHSIVIIGWHGVSISDEHKRFPTLFIKPETLWKRLTYLKKHYEIISLEEAVRQHDDGAIKPGQVVLTFDDGYYNFLSQAAPILRSFDATATVYMISNHMITGAPFHAPLIRDLVFLSSREQLSQAAPGIHTPHALCTSQDKASLIRSALQYMEPLSLEQRTGYARQLAGALEVDFDEIIEQKVWSALTCDEVRRLSDEGFSIQLHGHSHINVVDYPESVLEEVSTCKQLLENATGMEAKHFCYPTGLWNRASWETLRAVGIQSATTTRQGPNLRATPLLALRRVLDGEEQTQLEFEFSLSMLRWFLHVFRYPRRLHCPSEKLVRYTEDKTLF